jgi:hypothetical protein
MRSQIDITERSQVRVQVRLPNGSVPPAEQNEYEVDLEKNIRFRATMHFPGIPFGGSGIYNIIVQVRKNDAWADECFVPIEIVIRQSSAN